MFGRIGSIIAILKAVIDLWHYLQAWQDEQERLEVERKKSELAKALEDAKKAQSDEDIFKSQQDVIANSH